MNDVDSISIGVDIVSIQRMAQDMNKKNFINRVFTNEEIKYCRNKFNPSQHFAARFAGKEAVCKVLGITWEDGFVYKDIEIVIMNHIPQVILHGDVKRIAYERKIKNMKISLSHEKDYAIAFVLANQSAGSI